MEKKGFKSFLIHQPKQTLPASFDVWLLLSTVVVIIFVPFIPLSKAFFLSLEELFVGLLGIRLLMTKFFWIDRFVAILIAFGLLVAFTILINPHRTELREYFELYKFVKIAVVYIFSVYLFLNTTNFKPLISFINYSFLGLVAFNLLHYFDVWSFNENVTILFDSDKRDTVMFGLNSLGEPSTKRMIGTMGNPNQNAILFLFYFAFYLGRITVFKPELKKMNVYRILFVLATLMVLLCQSRTGIAIVGIMYIVSLFLRKLSIDVLYELALLGFAVLLMVGISSSSLRYLTNTDMNLMENSAVMGRLEVAKTLLSEWFSQPVFGYGPNKTYLYANKIYPENGYIFHLWRYGIFGLILYCATLWYLLITFFRAKVNLPLFLLVMLIFTIGGLTNLPLMNPKFSIIFAILAGFATCQFLRNKNYLNESVAESKA